MMKARGVNATTHMPNEVAHAVVSWGAAHGAMNHACLLVGGAACAALGGGSWCLHLACIYLSVSSTCQVSSAPSGLSDGVMGVMWWTGSVLDNNIRWARVALRHKIGMHSMLG
jgi:hypothetical protein